MKKPSVVSFLILLLAAAVLSTPTEKEFVTDKDGNPIEVGGKYFIQPVKTESNNGGGLVPAAINILPFCPLGITQTLLPYQPGLPVSLTFPYSIEETYFPIGSAANIEFKSDIWPVCDEYSKFWKVDDSSSAIVIGGEPRDKNSWFKIEKAGDGANTYKLSTSTGTVGTTPGAWLSAPQLIVTKDNAKTLLVKFSKVDDATTATTSTSRVEKLGLRMFPFY